MPVDAAEAHRIVNAEMQKLNNNRRLPATLPRLRKMISEDVVFICNVGPWARLLETASLKGFFIPAYDPSKDKEGLGYVKSKPIPAIFRTAKIVSEDEFGYIEDDGMQVALEAIGIGHSLNPQNLLTVEGFFVPQGKEATKAEIARAQQELSRYFDRLIEEARDAYDKGPAERKAVIGERHLLAATTRGIDEPWVHHKHTQENVRCAMCGKFNPSGVAKCQCGSILDVELFMRLQAQQEKMLERVTAPKR